MFLPGRRLFGLFEKQAAVYVGGNKLQTDDVHSNQLCPYAQCADLGMEVPPARCARGASTLLAATRPPQVPRAQAAQQVCGTDERHGACVALRRARLLGVVMWRITSVGSDVTGALSAATRLPVEATEERGSRSWFAGSVLLTSCRVGGRRAPPAADTPRPLSPSLHGRHFHEQRRRIRFHPVYQALRAWHRRLGLLSLLCRPIFPGWQRD